MNLDGWAEARQLYVATVGRRSGVLRPKWWLVFAVVDGEIHLLEEIGRDAQWIKNIEANPKVQVWIEGVAPMPARARIVDGDGDGEAARVRAAIAATELGSTLQDLVEWGLPVVITPDPIGETRRTW